MRGGCEPYTNNDLIELKYSCAPINARPELAMLYDCFKLSLVRLFNRIHSLQRSCAYTAEARPDRTVVAADP